MGAAAGSNAWWRDRHRPLSKWEAAGRGTPRLLSPTGCCSARRQQDGSQAPRQSVLPPRQSVLPPRQPVQRHVCRCQVQEQRKDVPATGCHCCPCHSRFHRGQDHLCQKGKIQQRQKQVLKAFPSHLGASCLLSSMLFQSDMNLNLTPRGWRGGADTRSAAGIYAPCPAGQGASG